MIFKKSTLVNSVLPLLLILGLCAWVYSDLENAHFVWDDVDYIKTNEVISKELRQSIPHYFARNYYVGNYHPITMSSYALIHKFLGSEPKHFRLIILILHLFNSILVWYFISLLFKNNFIALWIAAVFALHPLHVESVAWISSLKDVLFALFYLGGLIFYIFSLEKNNSLKFNLACFICFILSALSKPAALSFPLIILLIDYYYLGKIPFSKILNKIHYLLFALLMGFMTLAAQSKVIEFAVQYNFIQKIMIVSYSLVQYIVQFIFPNKLSALHPLPRDHEFNLLYKLSPIILFSLLVILWKFRNRLSNVVWGFLFFFVSIFLMTQWLSFGSAVMAERYTYLPYIGLSIALITGLKFMVQRFFKSEKYKNILIGIAILPVLAMSWISSQRVKVWSQESFLWEDVIKKYPDCSLAYYNLGAHHFINLKNDQKAHDLFLKSYNLNPKHFQTLINLGILEGRSKNYSSAIQYFQAAQNLNPRSPDLYKNRAYVNGLAGNTQEAINDISEYIKMNPTDAMMLSYRASLFQSINNPLAALEDLSRAIGINKQVGSFYKQRSYINNQLDLKNSAINDAQSAMQLGETFEAEYLISLGFVRK